MGNESNVVRALPDSRHTKPSCRGIEVFRIVDCAMLMRRELVVENGKCSDDRDA